MVVRSPSLPFRFSMAIQSMVTLWWSSVLKTEVLFENDYICTSSTDNEINLEIPLDTLSRALKSCSTSAETTIRLTKKSNNAYLGLTTSITVPFQHQPPNSLPSHPPTLSFLVHLFFVDGAYFVGVVGENRYGK